MTAIRRERCAALHATRPAHSYPRANPPPIDESPLDAPLEPQRQSTSAVGVRARHARAAPRRGESGRYRRLWRRAVTVIVRSKDTADAPACRKPASNVVFCCPIAGGIAPCASSESGTPLVLPSRCSRQPDKLARATPAEAATGIPARTQSRQSASPNLPTSNPDIASTTPSAGQDQPQARLCCPQYYTPHRRPVACGPESNFGPARRRRHQ